MNSKQQYVESSASVSDGSDYICEAQHVATVNVVPTLAYLKVKRLLDIVFSLISIVVFSPVLLFISILIKFTSKGSIFYKHTRVGYHGREFKMYKFRTMVSDADDLFKYFTKKQYDEFKDNYKLENDPRILGIGKFLRKSSLDELPQLLNILKGDMSFVGPRPIVRGELTKYGRFAEAFMSVKPGLTGLWQVNGRSTTTYSERVKMDINYTKSMCFILDLKLVFQTFAVVIKKRGAY